jgi:hypothetical protein
MWNLLIPSIKLRSALLVCGLGWVEMKVEREAEEDEGGDPSYHSKLFR